MTTPSPPSPQPSDKPGTNAAPSPAAMAKRGPKPGPLPGAGTHRPTPSPVPVTAPEPTDPTKFGRIDDDGTVYVTQGGNERAIGSWQAGTREEGLAHYGRLFDDLATEVELLEARLVHILTMPHPFASPQNTFARAWVSRL